MEDHKKMTTCGIQFLKQKKIAHQVVQYDHQEKGAAFAARAAGFPLEQTIKTLVVGKGANDHALALMPGDRQLSMKKLAKALAVKRLAMADGAVAQRVTGYLVGGISPFGTKKPLPVIMDASLKAHTQVMINAGQRGTMVQMNPEDIIQALNVKVVDISQP